MSDVIQIIIAKYPGTPDAEAALKKLQQARENQGVEYKDAAVVRRDEHGKLHIHETVDVGGGRGAAVGGVLGGVLGVIAGPAGVVAGAALGAAVGGAAASVLDIGIRHKRLEEIGATLEPQHAALVILTEQGFVPFIETLISSQGAETVTETMSVDAAKELEHAHTIALQALKLGDALADGGAIPTEEAR